MSTGIETRSPPGTSGHAHPSCLTVAATTRIPTAPYSVGILLITLDGVH